MTEVKFAKFFIDLKMKRKYISLKAGKENSNVPLFYEP